MQSQTEYNGTATNPKGCYSNLNSYGVGGNFVHHIINPLPAAIVPQLFWRLPPHKMPHYAARENNNNCSPYLPLKDFKQCHWANLDCQK